MKESTAPSISVFGSSDSAGQSKSSSISISKAAWAALSQGPHAVYVSAYNKAGFCTGCDGTISITVNKDTVAPTSTINETTAASGHRTSDDTYWFGKGATNTTPVPYAIPVTDSDGSGANVSGIDTNSCYYYIQDLGTGKSRSGFRACNSFISITVGPASSGADCQTQGQVGGVGQCFIRAYASDFAGNPGTYSEKRLNIDYTPPTAQ